MAGRRGPIRRYRLTTSGLITREAATSEHCVESRRHTGKESALYLATTKPPHPPTHPLPSNPTPPPSHPQQKQSLRGSAVSTPGMEKERRKTVKPSRRRSGDALMSRTCHHTCSPCLSNTMPDVPCYAMRSSKDVQGNMNTLSRTRSSFTAIQSMNNWLLSYRM